MPRIFLANPATSETITRPVFLEIARNLLTVMGLDPTTSILYPGDTQVAVQPGSTVQGQDNPFGNTTFPFTSRMLLETSEEDVADQTFVIAVYETENLPVFADSRVSTYLRPVYSNTEGTINFQFRATDKTTAKRWRDDMRVRVGMNQNPRIHQVSYNWLIPPEYMVILQEIHRLMQVNEPYPGEDVFDNYFALYASQRCSNIVTAAGTEPQMTVAETQMRIQGWFDFETGPQEPQKDDEGSSYTTSFTYKFQYQKPIGSVLIYPLMIHNQLIQYRPAKPQDMVDAHLRSYSWSTQALRQFEQGNQALGPSNGYAIPAFDEFIPAEVPASTLRVVTVLTSVDPLAANPRLLMNLTDLGGDWKLHKRIIRMLKDTEYAFATKLLLSPFVLSFYTNRILMDNTSIALTADLDVIAAADLSLRNYYHVRFALASNLMLLAPAAQERLRSNADVVCLILQALGLQNAFPKIVGYTGSASDIAAALALDSDLASDFASNYISRQEWDKAVVAINGVQALQTNSLTIQFNTVGLLTVQATREASNAGR